MAEYIEYHPLKFWLDPASIAEIVAHIQTYLVNNPINSTTEIETIIHDYLIAHPELIGGVDSVNGQTGEVVLTADNISAGENVTIKDVLDSLQDQIDDIVASIPSDYQQLINDVSDLKSAINGCAYVDKYIDVIDYVANSYIIISGANAGDFTSYSGWKRSNLILIKGASKISVKNTGANGSGYNAFYDANKNFISSFSFGAGNTEISVPQNAEYYAVSGANATMGASTFTRKWETSKAPIKSMYEDEETAEDIGYNQIKDLDPPENLYTKTCSSFGGSTVASETATITNVSQGIMTNPFESNSNCVRVTAKITFTTPNVHVLLPYYANNTWNYGNLLELDEIESGVEFTFDFDASYYIVYQSAERFRLIFQTRSETGVSDYSGTITITSLTIQSLDALRQSPYFDKNFPQMMAKVFSGIDVAKTMPERTADIYCNPNGDKVIFGVGVNNTLVAIPVVPGKTLFFGNSLLLGMNTSSPNHQYVYGMCATEPNKDYCHLVMNEITDIKATAAYDRVHGAQFETLEPSDSFSTLWNTTANTFTGEPLKNSFTNDLDLIVIQLSDNINTTDRRTAFVANVDSLLQNIRNASPNARLLWVYGWFSNADTNALITSACQRWGIESLNIHQYNTIANQGTSGQSYVDGSGQTSTVSDSWITHPGDNGFTAIADAIIDKLGID